MTSGTLQPCQRRSVWSAWRRTFGVLGEGCPGVVKFNPAIQGRHGGLEWRGCSPLLSAYGIRTNFKPATQGRQIRPWPVGTLRPGRKPAQPHSLHGLAEDLAERLAEGR